MPVTQGAGHGGLAVTWGEVHARAQQPVAAILTPCSLPFLYLLVTLGEETFPM